MPNRPSALPSSHVAVARRVAGVALLALSALVAACGGGSGDGAAEGGDGTAPPPVAASGPTAAFATAASGVTARQALAFDAGGSAAADGSALAYHWDFGDGQRGGGRTIAHVFAQSGSPTVTLTVVDAAGRSATASRTVAVAAPPAATGSALLPVQVRDLDGAAVAGAAVSLVGGGASGVTDANGRVGLSVGVGAELVVRVQKSGYADQVVVHALPVGAGDDGLVEATLRPRDAAQTLADAKAGGTLRGRAGATIVLPPDALVDAAGAPVTGAVDIAMTTVDVTAPNAGGFPGRFDGVRADGGRTPIASLGTVEFALSSGGRRLQLAPGKSATIEIPISGAVLLDGARVAAGATIDLWSLDEASGVWIQEGTGTVVASADAPGGVALRAQVAHFSWWNADIGFDPYGPQPKCEADNGLGIPEAQDNFARGTMCNFLAQFDRASNRTGNGAGRDARALRASALAASAPANIVGFARSGTLPIAGGVTVPVPANWNIAFTATALNGTWIGSAVVNGAVGVREPVVIKMRPRDFQVVSVEPIVLPFDSTRQLGAGQAARFSFAGAAGGFVQVTLSGGTVPTRVRLVRDATVLATRDVVAQGGATFVAPVDTAGTYRIEVENTALVAGGWRLQAVRLGGLIEEQAALPVDATRTIPAYTTLRFGLDVPAAGAVSLAATLLAEPVTVRVLGPDGTTVASFPTSRGATATPTVVATPAAGRYTLVVANPNGAPFSLRATAETTPWLPVDAGFAAPRIPYPIAGLQADRNGRPVLGFVSHASAPSGFTETLQLRRWTGSVWETAAADLLTPIPCDVNERSYGFAFDSRGVAYVANVSLTTRGSFPTRTQVRRFVGGAWEDVGGGALPETVPSTRPCQQAPRLVVDGNDRPVVAWRSETAVRVARFEGGTWTPLGSFPATDDYPSYDLALDAAGTPHLVLAQGGVARVQRHVAGAWQAVGADGGRLPSSDGSVPRVTQLRIDASGRLAVGALVSVGTDPNPLGAAAWRFDGTAWAQSGPRLVPAGTYVGTTVEPGVSVSADGSLLVSWTARTVLDAGTAVVLRNDPGGTWTGVGDASGRVPQVAPHGVTPDLNARDARLLSVGPDDWLALAVTDGYFTTNPTTRVVLLRRVGR